MGVQEGVEMTLAIDGGHPVRSKPLHSWPHFEEDEIEAVDRVLRSGRINYWTGDEGHCFESEFACACGSKYAVAVSNGTVALECILRALGIGDGDDVVVTSRSFVASASAVLLVGARPAGFAARIPIEVHVMKTFTAVVEKCPDTGLFVGYVPGFPGAHTQARTLDELNQNLREVIELLLEDGEPHLETEFVGIQQVAVA